MSSNDEMTICTQCNKSFGIDENRVYKVKTNSMLWFADAMKQFVHFNEVQCPSCGFKCKAKEAKLFFIFKSIYPVIAISIIFIFLLIIYFFYFLFIMK